MPLFADIKEQKKAAQKLQGVLFPLMLLYQSHATLEICGLKLAKPAALGFNVKQKLSKCAWLLKQVRQKSRSAKT